jgi:hypothetical protein
LARSRRRLPSRSLSKDCKCAVRKKPETAHWHDSDRLIRRPISQLEVSSRSDV